MGRAISSGADTDHTVAGRARRNPTQWAEHNAPQRRSRIAGQRDAAEGGGLMSETFTVHVPMTFRRRGGRKLIVAPDGAAMPAIAPRFNIDNVLVKALARAFRWQKLLDSGTYSTIREIAAKE